MLLNNKKALILSSLLILLPIPVGLLLKNQFPDIFWEDFAFSVFLPPLSLLAGHWLCILLTNLDSKNKNRNRKPLSLVLWIIPLISNLCCGILYALLLGLDFSPARWMTAAFGLMFAAIGNYLPKTRMNSTMGIKVPWTYSSEANWNATHRFAGKVWFFGGLTLLLGFFLPEGIAITLFTLCLIVLCILPICYSYQFYKREKAEGIVQQAGYSPVDQKILKVSGVFLVLLTIFLAAVLFVGNIEYVCEQDKLIIEADWYTDLSIQYEDIQAIEYRGANVSGMRVGGFESFRLLMGFFQNEEFGTYTRYTYYKPEACVVLTVKGRTVVLSAETTEETNELYQTLLDAAH